MPQRLSSKTPPPFAAEAARREFYYQEVPLESISKKAFYFDFLIGLTFFLKSQQTPPSADADGDADRFQKGRVTC